MAGPRFVAKSRFKSSEGRSLQVDASWNELDPSGWKSRILNQTRTVIRGSARRMKWLVPISDPERMCMSFRAIWKLLVHSASMLLSIIFESGNTLMTEHEPGASTDLEQRAFQLSHFRVLGDRRTGGGSCTANVSGGFFKPGKCAEQGSADCLLRVLRAGSVFWSPTFWIARSRFIAFESRDDHGPQDGFRGFAAGQRRPVVHDAELQYV